MLNCTHKLSGCIECTSRIPASNLLCCTGQQGHFVVWLAYVDLQVCRSLFEKDKLLFAFLMTVHLKAHVQHTLDWASLRFLLTGIKGHGDRAAMQLLFA